MIQTTIVGDGFSAVLPTNLAAVWRVSDTYGQLCAISLAGHERQIQAVSAGLQDASLSFSFDVRNTPLENNYSAVKRWERHVHPIAKGFELRKAKLAYDTWQLVAVCRDQRFFLHETDEAVWRVLRSNQFTTPLLRSWVPAIRGQLHKKGLLVPCDFLGPHFDKGGAPSFLLATEKSLDGVVSAGVRSGHLKIAA